MKQVTISTEALEAINEAGKRAARLTHGLLDWMFTSEPIDSNITYGEVNYVLTYVRPLLRDWTLGSLADAATHARDAYRKNALRHNVRVLNEASHEWRDIVKALAREKHYRRSDRKRYFEKVHINTILEAEREAGAKREQKRWHERAVAAVRHEIVKLAYMEAEIDCPFTAVWARSLVRIAILNANYNIDHFTASDFDEFLRVLDMELASAKKALAGKSESVAD